MYRFRYVAFNISLLGNNVSAVHACDVKNNILALTGRPLAHHCGQQRAATRMHAYIHTYMYIHTGTRVRTCRMVRMLIDQSYRTYHSYMLLHVTLHGDEPLSTSCLRARMDADYVRAHQAVAVVVAFVLLLLLLLLLPPATWGLPNLHPAHLPPEAARARAHTVRSSPKSPA